MQEIMEIKQYINDCLKQKEIIIPEEYRKVFDNHVTVLSERILNDECVDIDVTEMEKEFSEDSKAVAAEILKPLFDKYNVKERKAETALFALYINLAKEGGM